MKGMWPELHPTVKTDKQTLSVHLGPAWCLEDQDVKLAAQDRVEIKGSRITFAGKPALIAAEVKKGDETLRSSATAPASPCGAARGAAEPRLQRHPAMAKALIGGGVLWVALLCVAAGACAGEAVADVFDRVHRSVVVIRTTELDVAENGGGPVKMTGLGSGVLVSTDGQVLTADHLVHAAFEIYAEFPDGARVHARVRAAARSADLALLQLDRVPANAVVAPLADSDRARIGEQIFVVGAPHGFGHTLTVGHISARRSLGDDDFPQAEFLQTDAAINRGNSGGPMFNLAGEVLGIVSHIVSTSEGFEGLGFVVSVNTARALLLERPTAWLGVDGVPLRGDLLRIFNLREPGVLVQRVVERSPATALGLRGGVAKATIGGRTLIVGGDVLLRIQGVTVAAGGRAREALAALKPGDLLTVTIVRAGEVQELSTRWAPPE